MPAIQRQKAHPYSLRAHKGHLEREQKNAVLASFGWGPGLGPLGLDSGDTSGNRPPPTPQVRCAQQLRGSSLFSFPLLANLATADLEIFQDLCSSITSAISSFLHLTNWDEQQYRVILGMESYTDYTN